MGWELFPARFLFFASNEKTKASASVMIAENRRSRELAPSVRPSAEVLNAIEILSPVETIS
jgi:hypothetical protein